MPKTPEEARPRGEAQKTPTEAHPQGEQAPDSLTQFFIFYITLPLLLIMLLTRVFS